MTETIRENGEVGEVGETGELAARALHEPGGASGARPPRRLVLGVATAAGAGYAPVAPGTFGSAVGVVLYLPLSGLHPALFAVTLAAALFLGIWASDHAEREFGRHDDGRIVIDEVVGQLIALSPLGFIDAATIPLPLLVVGFGLFRLFDIWKPGPIRWAERHFQRGAGVMLDDVAAGVLAAVLLTPIALGFA